MKDTPRPHILSKFQPKTRKFLVVGTCPKSLYSQKTQSGPLGVKHLPKDCYSIVMLAIMMAYLMDSIAWTCNTILKLDL